MSFGRHISSAELNVARHPFAATKHLHSIKMISLATQKFIAEVAEDAMQYNKQRTGSKRSTKV